MNVFVLCTGRTGSVTFVRACQHMKNYTAAHESRSSYLGHERLNFPYHHVEVDNRLSWFLGRLEKQYSDQAFYVHLLRDRDKVAQSYNKRWFKIFSIMNAYSLGILKSQDKTLDQCYDYVDTVTENIEFFLRDKTRKMTIHLENIEKEFPQFWEAIGAEGNLKEAIATFRDSSNATSPSSRRNSFLAYYREKILRVVKLLPRILREI